MQDQIFRKQTCTLLEKDVREVLPQLFLVSSLAAYIEDQGGSRLPLPLCEELVLDRVGRSSHNFRNCHVLEIKHLLIVARRHCCLKLLDLTQQVSTWPLCRVDRCLFVNGL